MEEYIWRLKEKISTFTIDCYREMILMHYKPVKLEFIPLLNIHLKELCHAPISPLFKKLKCALRSTMGNSPLRDPLNSKHPVETTCFSKVDTKKEFIRSRCSTQMML